LFGRFRSVDDAAVAALEDLILKSGPDDDAPGLVPEPLGAISAGGESVPGI
jgi:hypothetical protein